MRLLSGGADVRAGSGAGKFSRCPRCMPCSSPLSFFGFNPSGRGRRAVQATAKAGLLLGCAVWLRVKPAFRSGRWPVTQHAPRAFGPAAAGPAASQRRRWCARIRLARNFSKEDQERGVPGSANRKRPDSRVVLLPSSASGTIRKRPRPGARRPRAALAVVPSHGPGEALMGQKEGRAVNPAAQVREESST